MSHLLLNSMIMAGALPLLFALVTRLKGVAGLVTGVLFVFLSIQAVLFLLAASVFSGLQSRKPIRAGWGALLGGVSAVSAILLFDRSLRSGHAFVVLFEVALAAAVCHWFPIGRENLLETSSHG